MEEDDSIIIWSLTEPGVRTEALFDKGTDIVDLVKYGPDDTILLEYHGSMAALQEQNELVQKMAAVRRAGQEG